MFKSRAFASVAPATQPSNPEDAMKQALCAVVQLWLDRLQSMAVITTFFVSIDSLLFSLTAGTRNIDLHAWSTRDKVINASLGGAIIFHVCASIVAYIGSFVLIRFRLTNAEKEEESVLAAPTFAPTPADTYTRSPVVEKRSTHTRKESGFSHGRSHAHTHHASASTSSAAAGPASPMDTIRDFPLEVFTDLRSLVSVDRAHPLWFLPWASYRRDARRVKQGPQDAALAALETIVGVLSRAHTVSATMASLGFVLALLGILTYSWTAVPSSLGIFASVCMGTCGLAAVVAFW
ncbi:hypothetical protein C8Q78DRAFT_1070722 [Trametes maxima]|nr:hypothetical protein C8Q78DRAFT_1070722 [Trametes maxima]